MNVTSITVDTQVKKRLERKKAHPRESFNDVIERLLSKGGERAVDTDSLIETIEVLSDPELMRHLARSLKQLKKGKLYTLDEVYWRKQLGLE